MWFEEEFKDERLRRRVGLTPVFWTWLLLIYLFLKIALYFLILDSVLLVRHH
ncbi:hypothetical protein J22TS1_39140 [Siminovitchia terrae]|nr:hypothetical protein J22TS1_39140 [Siminovitchia terrae]